MPIKMFDIFFIPDVFVDGCFVENLRTNRTSSIIVCLLSLRHEIAFMLHPDMSGQTTGVDKNFQTKCAFFRNHLMFSLLVPVQVSLSFENFATMTKKFFGRFYFTVGFMNLLVFG